MPDQDPPLHSTFSDDPEMQALLDVFVAKLPERVDALAKAMSDDSHDDLARMAHQLKGAGAGHGFAPISDAASALETLLHQTSGDVEAIRRALDELVDCCSRAVA